MTDLQPYEDGAIYLVREVEGGETELAMWTVDPVEGGEFIFFGSSAGFPADSLSQVIARIEYTLRPI